MSKFYGVLTVGTEDEPERVVRASRVGDDFITAELCTETHTFRLSLYADGSHYLDCIEKRWTEAQEMYEDADWDCLWDNESKDDLCPIPRVVDARECYDDPLDPVDAPRRNDETN